MQRRCKKNRSMFGASSKALFAREVFYFLRNSQEKLRYRKCAWKNSHSCCFSICDGRGNENVHGKFHTLLLLFFSICDVPQHSPSELKGKKDMKKSILFRCQSEVLLSRWFEHKFFCLYLKLNKIMYVYTL